MGRLDAPRPHIGAARMIWLLFIAAALLCWAAVEIAVDWIHARRKVPWRDKRGIVRRLLP